MEFNVDKSVTIQFSSRLGSNCAFDVTFSGERLPWATIVCHLGHILSNGCSDTADIDDKLHTFYGLANRFLAKLGSLRLDIKSKLFQAYCHSFFGCEVWHLSDGAMDKISVG